MTDRDSEPEDDDSSLNTYECTDCGHRIQAEHQRNTCPECDGEMTDISVPRE